MVQQKTSSIVITYNPDPENLESVLLTHLATTADNIIIVDNNSSNRFEIEFILNKINTDKIVATFLPQNMGIAAAQNIGIKMAKQFGAFYVVLFDQDMTVPALMIGKLIEAEMRIIASGKKVGAVGPGYTDPRSGNCYPQMILKGISIERIIPDKNTDQDMEVSFIIASGSLIRISTLDDVGLMNERLFIDAVDVEWCFRAQAKGYLIFVTTSAQAQHHIGDKRIRSLGREISIHSPLRKYYMMRNNILISRFKWVPLGYRTRIILNTFFRLPFYFYDVNFKHIYIKFMLKGIYDGLLNRGGAYKSQDF